MSPPYLEYDMLIELAKYLQDDYSLLTKAINRIITQTKEARKLLNLKTWTDFKKTKEDLIKKQNACNNFILFINDYLKEFKEHDQPKNDLKIKK